jgi:hypothetical protein
LLAGTGHPEDEGADPVRRGLVGQRERERLAGSRAATSAP